MKQIRWTFLCVLLFIACEHKELCYSHPHFVSVRVTFDWSQIYNHEKPSGMRVVFFPKDEKGESWTFDFPDGKDRVIEIPENDYQVVSLTMTRKVSRGGIVNGLPILRPEPGRFLRRKES